MGFLLTYMYWFNIFWKQIRKLNHLVWPLFLSQIWITSHQWKFLSSFSFFLLLARLRSCSANLDHVHHLPVLVRPSNVVINFSPPHAFRKIFSTTSSLFIFDFLQIFSKFYLPILLRLRLPQSSYTQFSPHMTTLWSWLDWGCLFLVAGCNMSWPKSYLIFR